MGRLALGRLGLVMVRDSDVRPEARSIWHSDALGVGGDGTSLGSVHRRGRGADGRRQSGTAVPLVGARQGAAPRLRRDSLSRADRWPSYLGVQAVRLELVVRALRDGADRTVRADAGRGSLPDQVRREAARRRAFFGWTRVA